MRINTILSSGIYSSTYGSRISSISSPSTKEIKDAFKVSEEMEKDFQEILAMKKKLMQDFPNPENKTFAELLEESVVPKTIEQELEEDGFILDIKG